MKIKHWQGYGCVTAKKVKDNSCTLHIRVEGNHEWGLRRDDDYDLFRWIVKRFDKTIDDDYFKWKSSLINLQIEDGWDEKTKTDICDYYFTYTK